MLRKITLKNIASYKEKEAILHTDKKINLIYGLNGSGKTTLSNYLYSRDQSEFQSCSMEMDEGDELFVYNQRFVDENFFSPTGLAGIFTLSKENKETLLEIEKKEEEKSEAYTEKAAKKDNIDKLKGKLEEEQKKAEDSVWKIKSSYYGGDRVLEFCLKGYAGSKKDLFNHLITIPKANEIDFSIDDIKKETQEILNNPQKLVKLNEIRIEDKVLEDNPIYQKQIIGNKDSSVADLISKLGCENWVRQGLNYVERSNRQRNEKSECPFCQEKTITNDFILKIQSFFDETYEKDVQSLNEKLMEIETAIGLLPEEKVLLEHQKIKDFEKDFSLAYRELKRLLDGNKAKIISKIKSPSSVIQLDSLQASLDGVNSIISEVNSLVCIHNEKIDSSEEVRRSIKDRFWSLMRFEYDKSISGYLNEKAKIEALIVPLSKELKDIEEKIIEQGKHISELQKKTVNIDEAIANISANLKDMGITHFELLKHDDSSNYRIVREGKDSNIYQTLSEGEKTIITFLYFLELCKGRKNPQEGIQRKVIVIDDPVSSLSHLYVFNVGRLIRTEFFESKKYEQVFILTHSLYFFHELVKRKRKGMSDEEPQNLFRIAKSLEGSQILEMGMLEVQNEYQSYWAVLKDKTTSGVLLANCMRNILEHFFGFIESHESLNNAFQQPELKAMRFQAFLRYMQRESHSDMVNLSDYKEIDHEQFKEAFKLVFEKTDYIDHYNKMMK